MKTKVLILLLLLALGCQSRTEQGKVVNDLTSPDGKMKMEFLLLKMVLSKRQQVILNIQRNTLLILQHLKILLMVQSTKTLEIRVVDQFNHSHLIKL